MSVDENPYKAPNDSLRAARIASAPPNKRLNMLFCSIGGITGMMMYSVFIHYIWRIPQSVQGNSPELAGCWCFLAFWEPR